MKMINFEEKGEKLNPEFKSWVKNTTSSWLAWLYLNLLPKYKFYIIILHLPTILYIKYINELYIFKMCNS